MRRLEQEIMALCKEPISSKELYGALIKKGYSQQDISDHLTALTILERLHRVRGKTRDTVYKTNEQNNEQNAV